MRIWHFIALVLLSSVTFAQAPADERTAYVSVVDNKDATAPGLGPSDFVVREDDISREVLRASTAKEPAHIALLIDTSQAIDEQVNDIRTALRDFVKQMGGRHEIALIGLGERPTVLVDYTRDGARLEKGIGMVFARSGSGMYIMEAIVEEANRLERRKVARAHMVVYAARGPEFSERHSQSVLDVLRESGATLHALPLNRPGAALGSREEQELQLTLANGTRMSGGRREDLLTSMALSGRLQSLGREIDSQYQVVYARPRKLIPPKSLEITVKKPDLTVRARRWP
jgi:VWFA-related protein